MTSLFGRIFRRETVEPSHVRSAAVALGGTLRDPGPRLLALLGGGGGPTAAGVSVTAESALSVPAVSCAVRAISEAIGQLPVHVYRRGANGARERATDHPAYAVLHDQANEWTSAYDLKRQLAVDALLHGDGLALAVKVRGQTRELIRLKPGSVTIEEAPDGGPRYLLTAPEGIRELPRADVLHIKGLSTDGLRGRSTVRLAAEAIGIALAQEAHAGQIFGQGGRPSGVIKHPATLKPEARSAIAAAWSAMTSGRNAGRTAVLDEGAEFQPLSFNSVDLQFAELRTFTVHEIARAFRVPPHLLMELGRATWSNSEEMGRVFLAYTLLPWIKEFEGAIARAVFSPDERKTLFAEFLVDDFNRADTAKRSEAYGKLIAARVMNPNEVRAAENLPPYAGGDEFLNPNVTAAPSANTGGAQ